MQKAPPVTHKGLFWPTLQAVKDLGGSATRSEVLAKVDELFPENVQTEVIGSGYETRLHHYAGWNLSRLKRVGLLDNSSQGVWSASERGRGVAESDADDLWHEVQRAYRELRQERLAEVEDAPDAGEALDDADDAAGSWKADLLERLANLKPTGFETLCLRLLREAGVQDLQQVGGAGDGGIDGVGVARLGLLSFPVYFQAKRYGQAVGSGVVRDFRGAMAGRGEKGLIITTASFTRAARAEATRDGVPAIDLVDGDQLCDQLRRFRLGVLVESRIVEDVAVDQAFWSTFA